MKMCRRCHNDLDESKFRLKGGYRLNTCRKCNNRKGKLDYNKNRKKLADQLEKVKLRTGCAICGWSEFTSGLDLHHLSGKMETISALLHKGRYGFGFICKEISKCAVLCARCHRGVHSGDVTIPAGIQPLNFTYSSRERCD